MTSLSQPQLTIKNNKVVPVLNPQQQAILTKRFGLPAVQARRFNNPSYKIRGRRRLPPYKMGMAQSYDHKRPPGADRRFDMPNIFSQSGFQVILVPHNKSIILISTRLSMVKITLISDSMTTSMRRRGR